MNTKGLVQDVIIFFGIGGIAYLLLKKQTTPTLSANTIAENLSTTCDNNLRSLEYQKNNLNYQNSSYGQLSRDDIQKLQDKFDTDKKNYSNSECAKIEPKPDPNYDEIMYDHNRENAGMLSTYCRKSPNYLYDSCRNLEFRRYGKNEISEDLISNTVLSSQDILSLGNNYYSKSGDILANTCVDLDNQLSDVQVILESVYKMNDSGMGSFYEQIKKDTQAKFDKFNCRDKIEAKRTKDLVDLQSQGAILAEQSIIGSSFKNQNIYIAIGGLVLLGGLYVVIKK